MRIVFGTVWMGILMVGCEEKSVVRIRKRMVKKELVKSGLFDMPFHKRPRNHLLHVPISSDIYDVISPISDVERLRLRACIDGSLPVLLNCRGHGWEYCLREEILETVTENCALYAVLGLYRSYRAATIRPMPRVDIVIEESRRMFAPMREMAKTILELPGDFWDRCRGDLEQSVQPAIMTELVSVVRAMAGSVLFTPQLDELEIFAATQLPGKILEFTFMGDYKHEFLFNLPPIQLSAPADLERLEACLTEEQKSEEDPTLSTVRDISEIYIILAVKCGLQAVTGEKHLPVENLAPGPRKRAAAYMQIATERLNDTRLLMIAVRRTVEELFKRIDTIPVNPENQLAQITDWIHELVLPLRQMPRYDLAHHFIEKWLKHPSKFVTEFRGDVDGLN